MRDCLVDDASQVVLVDGRVLNDAVATKLFETDLVLADGRWKVSDNSMIHRWDGLSGCALDGSR